MAPTDLRFDSFTSTAATRKALALARATAAGGVGAPRLLFLQGAAGAGKTHLLRAIVGQVRHERPGLRLVQATGKEMVEDLVAALRQGHGGGDPLEWQGAALIALDDLHVLADLEMVQREVARWLRGVVEAGTRVVCAAGCPLSDLGILVAALRNLRGFAFARVKRASDRDLRQILARTAGAEGVRPDGRTLSALAASAGGDVRRALGALARHRFARSL